MVEEKSKEKEWLNRKGDDQKGRRIKKEKK